MKKPSSEINSGPSWEKSLGEEIFLRPLGLTWERDNPPRGFAHLWQGDQKSLKVKVWFFFGFLLNRVIPVKRYAPKVLEN